MLLVAPEAETPRHGFHHPGTFTVFAAARGPFVERHSKCGVPIDIVTAALLIEEEAGKEEALCTSGLHDLGIQLLAAIEDVDVENGNQTRRRSWKRVRR